MAPSSSSSASSASRGRGKGFALVAAVYLLGLFIGALDTGIVTPARTVIQSDLGIGEQMGVWIITIYTLAYAAAIPVMGKLEMCIRDSRTIMLLALACYAIGYGLLDLWSFGALDGSVVEAGSGLMMGFGAAVMCLVWMSRLHVLEFRRALVVAWVAGCVLFASASLLPMLGATPARTRCV